MPQKKEAQNPSKNEGATLILKYCFAEYALCLLFIPSAFPYAILYIMRDSNLGKMCVLWERTQEQRTERV